MVSCVVSGFRYVEVEAGKTRRGAFLGEVLSRFLHEINAKILAFYPIALVVTLI